MRKCTIEIPRTSRYYLFGNEENPKRVWVVLHGYGQQAKYFVPKVKALDNGESLIVVVEAMNRFYLSGFKGRVGATWMTSDDRELDIADNNRYLELLTQQVLANYANVEVNVLAFSQGIATACRWLASSDLKVKQAILWAGSVPPDLDWKKRQDRFNSIQIKYVFGNKDVFFDTAKIEANLQLLKESNIAFDLVTFDGKHEVDESTLKQLLE